MQKATKVATSEKKKKSHTASIRSLISVSFKVDPYFLNPTLSSSNVIAPLLSVSMAANISFKPAISSSDKLSAMTWRHKINGAN